jgi:NADH-quinone oxidoreductase subunit M
VIGILALIVGLAPAAGAEGRHAGHVVLSLPGGGPGPLELTASQGGWVGTFTLTNLGAEPLVISRIAIRGDELDVRSPSRLSVHFVDGPTTSATLAPGAAKDVVVAWMPDRDPRVQQAFGQVVVTSTDEEAGEVAMGFRAQLPNGLGWLGAHALSVLVALPLVIMLVALSLRAAGRPDDPVLGRVSMGVAAAELLLAAWVYQRFAPGVGRSDGNDGFQFVDRAVWVRSIGAEWYLGVDGVSVALVLLTTLVAVAAFVAAEPPDRRTDTYFSAMALLLSGLLGVLVALDLVLVLASWGLVFLAMAMLVGEWGSSRAVHAAAKTAVYGAMSSAALLAAFVVLSQASGRAFLVDGTSVAHTLAIPELARTTFAARLPVLGAPVAAGAWVLLFVGVAVMAPVLPLHGWLPDALEESPAGAAMLIAGAALAIGPYLLVRIGMGAVGEAARWAGPWVATLGVLVAIYGALGAMAQRTLRRFVAFASLASCGACLFGIGSLTPQGVAGATSGLFAHGIAASLLLGVAGALDARSVRRGLDGRDALHRWALGQRAPRLGALLGVGLAVSLGLPCLVGFWGRLLVLLGGFAPHPAMALLLALSFVVLAAGHVRIARITLSGSPTDTKSSLRALPDAMPRELAALVPLILLAVLLGVWPAPLLSQIASGASDASAAAEQAGTTP